MRAVNDRAGSVHMDRMIKRIRLFRPSSPFTGSTRNDLAMLRTLAYAVLRWEIAARDDRYYTLPFAPQLLHNDGGIHQAHVLSEFENRAWDRLMQRPNADAIWEARRLARMRRYEPEAYEVLMLRQELAEHKASCRCGS